MERTFVLERCGDGTGKVVVTDDGRHRKPRWVSITRECPACGKVETHSVRTIQSWIDKPHCCSWPCKARYRRTVKRHKERTCVICGNSFTTTRRDASYCSNACRQKAYRAGKSS